MWLHRTAEVSNVAWIWSLHVLLLKPLVFMSRLLQSKPLEILSPPPKNKMKQVTRVRAFEYNKPNF